jgi:hypothetical protein
MHKVDPDHSAQDGPASTPAPDVFSKTAAGRVWRMLSIVLGGAVTGMLIGAPVGLAADAAGVPSGGAAAFAALAFLTLALGVRWFALRVTRETAEVTPLFEERDEAQRQREAA